MFKEFKEFAMRGNVVDMAVGIIIGGAFGTIVKSMVDDVLMPPIGMALGGVDFSNFFLTLKEGAAAAGPYAALADAKAAGAVTVNYGLFLNAVISVLTTQNADALPQLGDEPAALVQLDAPIVNQIAPGIRSQLDLPLRVALALGAGIELAFLVEYLDPTVRGRDELERSGWVVLGEIPKK